MEGGVKITDDMMRISVKKRRIKIEVQHPELGFSELQITPLFAKIEKNKITVNRKKHALTVVVAKKVEGMWGRLLKNSDQYMDRYGPRIVMNLKSNAPSSRRGKSREL